MKFKKNQIVVCFGRMFKITYCNKRGFTGNEYDIEAIKPDKSGYFETHTRVPEGFIS